MNVEGLWKEELPRGRPPQDRELLLQYQAVAARVQQTESAAANDGGEGPHGI